MNLCLVALTNAHNDGTAVSIYLKPSHLTVFYVCSVEAKVNDADYQKPDQRYRWKCHHKIGRPGLLGILYALKN